MRVNEHSPRCGWRFEPARNAHSQESILVIVEYNAIECVQCGDAVNHAGIAHCRKHQLGGFVDDGLAFASYPRGLGDKFTTLRAALGLVDLLEHDRAHLRLAIRLDGLRVVPEIVPIHVRVVEPQSHVMRMIASLARFRWPMPRK